jgi:hypothetical protein
MTSPQMSLGALFSAIRKVAVPRVLESGFRVIVNSGSDAEQTVQHLRARDGRSGHEPRDGQLLSGFVTWATESCHLRSGGRDRTSRHGNDADRPPEPLASLSRRRVQAEGLRGCVQA